MNTQEIRKLIDLMESYNTPILNEAFAASFIVDEIIDAIDGPIRVMYDVLLNRLHDFTTSKSLGQRLSGFSMVEVSTTGRWVKEQYEPVIKSRLYYLIREYPAHTEEIKSFLSAFAGTEKIKYGDIFNDLIPILRKYAMAIKYPKLLNTLTEWVRNHEKYNDEKQALTNADEREYGGMSRVKQKNKTLARTVPSRLSVGRADSFSYSDERDNINNASRQNNAIANSNKLKAYASTNVNTIDKSKLIPDTYYNTELTTKGNNSFSPKSTIFKQNEPAERPPSAEEKALMGQQNAAANAQVNQILKMLPSDVAGDIRQEIARSPNKLLSLRAAFKKRGINMQ